MKSLFMTKKTKKSSVTTKKTGPSWWRKLWSLTWKLSIVGIAVVSFYAIYLDQIIAQKFEGQKWHLPAQVFSRSMALYPGAAISHPQLMAELKLLGYRKVANPRQVGEFSASRR